MSIKKRFDILTAILILAFILTFGISYFVNNLVYQTTTELVNVTKELDFLTSLKTTLTHLEHNLDNYLDNPDERHRLAVEEAIDQLTVVLSKTSEFKMDEDEIEIVGYMRKNIGRFNGYVHNILYPSETTDVRTYYNTLRGELFAKVQTAIEKHWEEDIEKVQKAELKASEAQKKLLPVVSVTLFVIIIMSFIVRRAITKGIVKPIQEITKISFEMASGNLDRVIEIKSGDELEELARNFNLMASALKEKISDLENSVKKEQKIIRELAILNEFMGFISSEIEIETILQRFAERASDLLKAEYGAILMKESGMSTVFLSTSKDIKRETIESMLKEESHYQDEALDALQIIRRNDLSIEIGGGKRIRNILALPLGSTTDLRCILFLLNKEDGFTEEDEDSLFNFAFQGFQTIALQYELAKLATTDGLTGLYNHRMFQERLTEEISRAKRYKRKLFVLMIDIDYFKKFNDNYGHQTGDEVLKTVARLIKENVRSVDFPARYGGEEFVLILPETDCEHAYNVGERIRKKVESYPFYLKDGSKVTITVSIGIACYPYDTEDKTELLKMADAALYYAKQKGRNRVYLYRDIEK